MPYTLYILALKLDSTQTMDEAMMIDARILVQKTIITSTFDSFLVMAAASYESDRLTIMGGHILA